MSTTKLVIGGKSGSPRFTKAGIKSSERFMSLIKVELQRLGAVDTGHPCMYPWSIETRAGSLLIHPYADEIDFWIACRFEDVSRAREVLGVKPYQVSGRLNPYSGKWNFHYYVGAAEAEVADFVRQLEVILAPQLKGG